MREPELTILVVTQAEPCVMPLLWQLKAAAVYLEAEFVAAADGEAARDALLPLAREPAQLGLVRSQGYLESVLDAALGFCRGRYVLRLDDDEALPGDALRWLRSGAFRAAPSWKFPRVHLWQDSSHALATPHLWPDFQTRLSLRAQAGGRQAIHAGSPFGGGAEAPCVIEHHKFLVRSLEARRAIVRRYDGVQPGAGSSFRAFSCPEDFYSPAELAAARRLWSGGQLLEEAG
jgi:hypothetical protein